MASGPIRLFTGQVSRNAPGQPDLERAHNMFLETGSLAAAVRPVVAESWRRSLAAGLNAEHAVAPVILGQSELVEYRSEHRLSRVFPLLYDILGRIAEDCECVMALGDEHGQLLWVCGQPEILRQAETIHFAEGTAWDESSAGTNAPGTALRLDAPVIISAAEHFNRSVQRWSCAAAPIHDPATQAILGVLDITGGPDVASPQTLGMVRAAARMAEIELARINAVELPIRSAVLRPRTGPTRMQALGRPDCAVSLHGRDIRLSPRHSEIVVLLLENPSGMTGEQLAAQVYPADVHGSTMRSEMNRLRTLLGPDRLESRPYRIVGEVSADWQLVTAHLAAGRVNEAATAYRGPLLPYSEAPGIVELREGLHRQVRTALLGSGVADYIAAWTRTRWGADDLEMWDRQAALLPPSSPMRAVARAEVDRLDARYR